MKVYSYNNELKYCKALFLDAICNDIAIRRSSSKNLNDANTKTLNVRAVYGARSRLFKQLENPEKTAIKLPVIAATLTGISQDKSRIVDSQEYLARLPNIAGMTGDALQNAYNYYPPNPINLSFTVNFMTRYEEDLDQIITNITSLMTAGIYVVSPHPKYPSVNIKHQITWQGSVTVDDKSEPATNEPIIHTASADFVFKTWFFPGFGPAQEMQQGIIKRVNFFPELVQQDGYTTLSNFHVVPLNTNFSTYMADIINGKVQSQEYYDKLALRAIEVTGNDGSVYHAFSGWWAEISGVTTGQALADAALVLDPNTGLLIPANEDGSLVVASYAYILPPSVKTEEIPQILANIANENWSEI